MISLSQIINCKYLTQYLHFTRRVLCELYERKLSVMIFFHSTSQDFATFIVSTFIFIEWMILCLGHDSNTRLTATYITKLWVVSSLCVWLVSLKMFLTKEFLRSYSYILLARWITYINSIAKYNSYTGLLYTWQQ